MFKNAIKNLKNLRAITGTAILSALHTVLHFFTTVLISQTSRITLGFLTFALCGYLYGPILAGIMGIIVDLLDFAIKNDGGAFFVGFTFNNFLNGFLYGLFLYQKKLTPLRIFLAVLTVNVVISLGLTPLWLSVLYGKGYLFYVSQRFVRILITIPIQTIVLNIVLNKADEMVKKINKKLPTN
ncbi:MAG: folate family ECF transporter S component [Clostridia bacterium]|nr:folate family ECF transporter S component [Clostridia bacterium]